MSLVRRQTSVFDESSGLSLAAWKLVRWLYVRGARGGILGRSYAKLRAGRDYNADSLLLNILARSLRNGFTDSKAPVVVAHPTLVAVLRGKCSLSYQHGELVAPGESLVRGATRVFVPTEDVANRFIAAGYTKEQVIVSGLCIEPSLAKQADDAFHARVDRINRRGPLTGAFFSSGAEPPDHVDLLTRAARSTVDSGDKIILFCRPNGQFLKRAEQRLNDPAIECEIIDSTDFMPKDLPQVLIVTHNSRREETIFTSRLFPYFDYFAAPSHERSNWALGIGLPMFVIGPTIGPFSPLNRDMLLRSGVAEPIDRPLDAQQFGETLIHLRHLGRLTEMAINGWHKFSIDGFDKIADFLVKVCETDPA